MIPLKTIRRAALGLAVALPMVVASLSLGPANAQTFDYEWLKLGTSTQKLFHRATAFDSTDNVMYVYGGYDVSNVTRNNVDLVRLSDPLLSNASIESVRPAGAVGSLWGSSGTFRSNGGDRQAIWTGGANTSNDPYEQVQILDVTDMTWKSVRPVGRFSRRVLHVSAYDPLHDVVVVHGGSERCELLPDDPADRDCEEPNGDTLFLGYDSATDTWSWTPGPTGPKLFGHAAGWDADRDRMLIFGGTYDRLRGDGDVWELDLSDADLDKAEWRRVDVAPGPAPRGRALHAGGFNDAQDHFVIYGGAERSVYGTSEVVAAPETWALDFGATTPTWVDLGAAAGDKVAASMAYDPLHNTMIMWGGRGKVRADRQTISSDVLALERTILGPPTATPTPRPVPTSVIPLDPKACDFIDGKVPPVVIAFALANPTRISGYAEPANPSLPPGIRNPPRVWLTLRNPAVPYNALFNSLAYRAGCP